jgi:hypothetical protein
MRSGAGHFLFRGAPDDNRFNKLVSRDTVKDQLQ